MTLILDKENPLATKVKTRDGKPARIICIDRKGDRPLVGGVLRGENLDYELLDYYYTDGRCFSSSMTNDDLVNVNDKPESALSMSVIEVGKIYKVSNKNIVGKVIFDRRSVAPEWAAITRFVLVVVKDEDDQGLYTAGYTISCSESELEPYFYVTTKSIEGTVQFSKDEPTDCILDKLTGLDSFFFFKEDSTDVNRPFSRKVRITIEDIEDKVKE